MDSRTAHKSIGRRIYSKIGILYNNMISNFLFRMVVSTAILSMFWGWLIYLYQTDQIKNRVFLELNEASQAIAGERTTPFDKIEPRVFEAFISEYNRKTTDFRIVAMDIYDGDGIPFFHFGGNFGKKGIDARTALPPRGDRKTFTAFKYRGDIYFNASMTIHEGKRYLGAVDLVIVAGRRILGQFRKALLLAIVHAVGTTTTMTLVLFPLILTSYRRLQSSRRGLLISHLQTIKALGNVIAERDHDTDEHNYRVTYFSLGLAERLKLPDQSIRALVKGAFLHDIGKIGIPDSILLKNASLSNQELAIMRTHVEKGIRIVESVAWLEDSIDIIRFHHERYDGSGYPSGAAGESIPVTARIFAIADVFDALISERPYKPAMSHEKAIMVLKQECRRFDPFLLSIFLEISQSQYETVGAMAKAELEMHLIEKLSHYFDL